VLRGKGYTAVTLGGIRFFPVREVGGLYRFDAAESKLLHHPPLSRGESLNSETVFLVKYISGKADLVGQIAVYIFVSEELQR
jgi:hypothetical protein